ncbi:hypothetical protein OAS46_07130, partial [Alphaproteobacteria bacterium]|nr:hypothetical protein [Alphaproteobacteria bacterium]
SITEISVTLFNDKGQTDIAGKVQLDFNLSVAGGRATSLAFNGLSVDVGNMHVGFVGPITFDSNTELLNNSDARFEISYDSDPGENVVLSTVFFEGALSYDVDLDKILGTVSDFGFQNEGGHHLYTDGLNASDDIVESLLNAPDLNSLLNLIPHAAGNTVFTQTDLTVPKGFENAVIEGTDDINLIGNDHDNSITGNVGDNDVDGGAGSDTFVVGGSSEGVSATLNQNGTVTLTTQSGGVDKLSSIEHISFSDGEKSIGNVITNASSNYSASAQNHIEIQLTSSLPSNEFLADANIEDFGRAGKVVLSNSGQFSAQALAGIIRVVDSPTGIIEDFLIDEARPYGNFDVVSVSNDGTKIVFRDWNGLMNDGGGGLYSINLTSNQITRVDTDAGGATVTYQGWSYDSTDVDVSSDGRYVAYAGRDLVDPDEFHAGQKVNIFLKDLETGALQKIDASNFDQQSGGPRLSDDGRFVVFTSYAELTESDFLDGEEFSNDNDMFLFDRDTGLISRVNEDSNGNRYSSDGYGFDPDISADGSKIAFQTGTVLDDGDTNGLVDVFIKDMVTGSIERVSDSTGGIYPLISPDGNFIAFSPYNYSIDPLTKIANIQTGEIWQANSDAFITHGSFSSENFYQLTDTRAALWTWNDYEGVEVDDGDADYLVMGYRDASWGGVVSQVDGQSLPLGFDFDATTGILSTDQNVADGLYYFVQSAGYTGGEPTAGFSVSVGFGSVDTPPTQPPSNPAFTINKLSQSGDTVVFGLYADPSQDPGGDGIGSFAMMFDYDPSVITVDDTLVTFGTGLSGQVGTHDTSTGQIEIGGFAFPNVTEFSLPFMEVTATLVDASQPVVLNVTSTAFDDVDVGSSTATFEFNSHELSGTITSRGGGMLSDVSVTVDVSGSDDDLTA